MLGVTGICVILLLFFSLFYIGARLGQMQEEDEEFRKAANKTKLQTSLLEEEASELPTSPQC